MNHIDRKFKYQVKIFDFIFYQKQIEPNELNINDMVRVTI